MDGLTQKKEQPAFIENQTYSPNVWAICNNQLMVMCYCYLPGAGYVWTNCYGQIDGDGEYDDDYEVDYWQYFPSIEGVVSPIE